MHPRDRALYLITAGRAAELLRASVRDHLAEVQRRIGFRYIRCHGLFHDEMMICRRGADGALVFAWHYLDEVFDFLLSIGLRPFVELGFTPEALRSGPETCFEWKANITPPAVPAEWDQLVTAFVAHCQRRYGTDEVRSWYFEVWNEPNLGGIFWTGGLQGYLDLFARTYRVIKALDSTLRVGGPATSNFTKEGEGPWFREFDAFCQAEGLKPDFYSVHPYPNSWALDTAGQTLQQYLPRGNLRQDCRWLETFLTTSANPQAEVHLTEWNSSPSPRDLVHDTAFMGPFVLDNLADLPDAITSVGYWAVSDVFEENGLPPEVFHGGFGLVTVKGWKKPSWFAYHFLSRLTGAVVARGPGWLLAAEAGTYQMLAWTYVHYTPEFAAGDRSRLLPADRAGAFADTGVPLRLEVFHQPGSWAALVEQVDAFQGSVFDHWRSLGAPMELTRTQETLLAEANAPRSGHVSVGPGKPLVLELPAHAVAFVTLTPLSQEAPHV